MRESSWLTSEEAENRLARREGYVLSPVFFRRAIVQIGLLAGGAAFLVGGVMAAIANPANLPTAIGGVAALSLGAIPLVAYWERRQAARHEPDLGLVEGFGGGKGWLVELIVRQGNAPTGIDRGMLWIEDERLFFSGHRTSFGLVPSQAQYFVTGGDFVPGIQHDLNLLLREKTAVGPVSLSIGLFLTSDQKGRTEREALSDSIDKWLKSRSSKAGQLPPLELGPGIPTERRLLSEAAFSGLGLPIALLLIFTPATIVALVLTFLFQEALNQRITNAPLRFRALLDRRRLRRAR